LKKKLFEDELLKPCCFCSKSLNFETATIEHIIPLSKGGNWKIDNLDISCSECNNERSSKGYSYFRITKWNELNKYINCIGTL